MANNLCYKSGSTIKTYELRDSVDNTPKFAVKVGTSVKYLALKPGVKSGEISVKINNSLYHIQNLKNSAQCYPVKTEKLLLVRSQNDADSYNWSSDPEQNNNLCYLYSTSGRAYVSDGWGGYGPFRMWPATADGTAITSGGYFHTVTVPFYFLWTDNPNITSGIVGGGSDRWPAIKILDVLRNGSSLRSYVGTSTPILFDEGDRIGAVIQFSGYNTRHATIPGSYLPVKFYPVVRPTDVNTDVLTAPFGFYFRHPVSSINNANFYGNLIDFEETPNASTAGLATRSSPTYYTSKLNYRYYPNDNGLLGSSQTYYQLYSHRHGCHVYAPKIIVNGSQKNWNREFDIHVGDKITMLFRVDQNYGDNFWSWDYGIRPKLRAITL